MTMRRMLPLLMILWMAAACAPTPPPSSAAPAGPPTCYLPDLEGAPAVVRWSLMSGLTTALQQRGWTITRDPTEAHDLVLRGRMVDDPAVISGPYAAVLDWMLEDSRGIGLALFRQRLGGSTTQWLRADPRVIRALIDDAAPRVVGLPRSPNERRSLKGVTGMVDVFVPVTPVHGDIKRVSSVELLLPKLPLPWVPPVQPAPAKTLVAPAAPAPVAPTAAEPPPAAPSQSAPVTRRRPSASGPVVLVGPVEGAPGDGADSLALALERTLARTGVPVTTDPTRATHVVRATVDVVPGGGARPTVNISWSLYESSGRRLGTIDQQNRIRAPILYDRWGATAVGAANGAAQGVVELLVRWREMLNQPPSGPEGRLQK
ncbi:hypothetical protein [Magnetospira sp. QH-2]|uniref:hypothetical protein n=1 Tax=Magnetospira sp. (strain QH-2) TaxID=1288970 RepID=UPI0003E811CD|nr:hypothetical protein [Magnetospira sp. QH-2]CCQ72277.1 exported protein of unknown function [Magnetospira sp. QH-2]